MHGPRSVPHFPEMCLPSTMEIQPKSALVWVIAVPTAPASCLSTAVHLPSSPAVIHLPFASPHHAFWGVPLTSGGSKHSCGEQTPWYINFSILLAVFKGFFFVQIYVCMVFYMLFMFLITIYRTEFNKQNHFSILIFHWKQWGGLMALEMT